MLLLSKRDKETAAGAAWVLAALPCLVGFGAVSAIFNSSVTVAFYASISLATLSLLGWAYYLPKVLRVKGGIQSKKSIPVAESDLESSIEKDEGINMMKVFCISLITGLLCSGLVFSEVLGTSMVGALGAGFILLVASKVIEAQVHTVLKGWNATT